MAIAADSIYSETLQSLIDAKLEELERKKKDFASSKASVGQAFSQQSDEAERVRILKDGIKTCFKLRGASGSPTSGLGVDPDLMHILENLDWFLEQPRYDPSLSSRQLQTWASSLGQYLDVQTNRYEYASLYAKLVTEWLTSEKRLSNKKGSDDAQMSDSFEELESSAKLQSRQEWEESVFQPAQTDADAMNALLTQLFADTEGDDTLTKAVSDIREAVKSFGARMTAPGQFNPGTVKWCAEGLLSGDVLSEDKRTVLRDFLGNQIILAEIADVLNLRLTNIDNWSWGATVPVIQERRVAGEFAIFMQEELLQAIFLQYIGVKWSVFMKEHLTSLVRTPGAWASSTLPMTRQERGRRRYYLGPVKHSNSLSANRHNLWLHRYFMTQLLDSEDASVGQEDGAEEANFDSYIAPAGGRTKQTARKSTGGKAPRKQMAVQQAPRASLASSSKRRRTGVAWTSFDADSVLENFDYDSYVDDDEDSSEDDDDEDEDDNVYYDSQSSILLKQGLLHLLRTEILINKRLHGDLTGFRAQFESWNSLLPHETILVVAKYFGVPEDWLNFFRSFLQAPLGFVSDGVVEEARTRRRGAPGSHPLSDVLGEMILFCLDMAVNKSTGGQNLWRVHDDVWFWSVEHEKSVKAWSAITSFCQTMGLSLDMNKAGSVRVSESQGTGVQIDRSLPQENIRWGFLYLDSQTGQWEIDERLVAGHTDELRHQLANKDGSILAWVQAWNAYANTFFTTNFGRPARCFGRAHTQKVLLALEKVQRRLFEDDESTNVVDHLKAMLESRFGVSDVPEGYCFFPTELGGLGLQNPFVGTLLVQETQSSGGDPEGKMDTFERAEREAYEKLKKAFEEGRGGRSTGKRRGGYVPSGPDRDVFMPFEEFVKYRESTNYQFDHNLRQTYSDLLEESQLHQITPTTDITTAMRMMDTSGIVSQSSGIKGNWHYMTAYWKWITQMYGPEMVKRFGGLNIVDNGVLPIGMVSLFRSNKVKWKA